MKTEIRHLASLDALRGIACCLVLYFHLTIFKLIPPPNFQVGVLGVNLFFVLSGFLMAVLYLKEENNFAFWLRFCIRRFFRIYPLFAVMTLVALPLHAFIERPDIFIGRKMIPPMDIAYTLNQLLLQKGMGHFWTIIVEMHFYFAFCILAFGIYRLSARQICALLLVLAIMTGWLLKLPKLPNLWIMLPASNTYEILPHFSTIFLTGILTGYVYKEYRNRLSALMPLWNCIYVLTGMFLIACIIPFTNELIYQLKINHYMGWEATYWVAPILALTIFSFSMSDSLHRKNPLGSLFNFLGMISYSLYLVHGMIFSFFPDIGLPNYLMIAILLSISLVAAWCSYCYIEKPGIALGKTIIQKL